MTTTPIPPKRILTDDDKALIRAWGNEMEAALREKMIPYEGKFLPERIKERLRLNVRLAFSALLHHKMLKAIPPIGIVPSARKLGMTEVSYDATYLINPDVVLAYMRSPYRIPLKHLMNPPIATEEVIG